MTELPIYPWFDVVPQHLKTRNQLAALGLRPGGPVVARVVWQRGRRRADLYEMQMARPKRALTEAQHVSLEKVQAARRICSHCGQDAGYVLSGRRKICSACQVTALEAIRRADRVDAIQQARQALQRSDAVFLDTETTDLNGYLVQIGILSMDGSILLDTLVNPQTAITKRAQRVHGITAAQVTDAPAFVDLADQITAILHGQSVWVYNAAFDRGILWNEVDRLARTQPEVFMGEMMVDDKSRAADRWCSVIHWCCAMRLYAAYVGEWIPSYQDYRRQPLPGGDHSAIGDCRALLALLRQIASYNLDT